MIERIIDTSDDVYGLMEEHYLPLARERKMELSGVWFFPPFEIDDQPADIV